MEAKVNHDNNYTIGTANESKGFWGCKFPKVIGLGQGHMWESPEVSAVVVGLARGGILGPEGSVGGWG